MADLVVLSIDAVDDLPACRVCGCTDLAACPGGCWWVPDPLLGDLCSTCAAELYPGLDWYDLDDIDDDVLAFDAYRTIVDVDVTSGVL